MDLNETFGPAIHRYTREQAIADGSLIDVTAAAREAGLAYPLALTAAAWAEAVAWDHDNHACQDEAGRLWDVLTMASHAARCTANPNADTVTFQVLRIPNTPKATRPQLTELVLHIGPGDDGEPVLTVMTLTED